MEEEVQRALQETKQERSASTTSAATTNATTTTDTTSGESTVETIPLENWSIEELAATFAVLRTCIESNPTEATTKGYANPRTKGQWQDSASSQTNNESSEWIATAALEAATTNISPLNNPIIRAAGMSLWCSTLLHIIRVVTNVIIPPDVVR